jgi:hypothetical protein
LPGAKAGSLPLTLVHSTFTRSGARATRLNDGHLSVTMADGSVTVTPAKPTALASAVDTAMEAVWGRPEPVTAGPHDSVAARAPVVAPHDGVSGLPGASARTRGRFSPAQALPSGNSKGGTAFRTPV